MDLYIQFRETRPQHSSSPFGDVIAVYETEEIVEKPAGHLAWVKLTNLPATQGKQKLFNLLAGRVGDDIADENDPNFGSSDRNAVFDFANLPTPYLAEFQENRSVDIPYGVAVSLLTSRKLGRTMNVGDFD